MAGIGFYGNLSSINRSTFVFDRVYTTRAEMDSNAATDGIFINRYVLVEYGNQPNIGYLIGGVFYSTPIASQEYRITPNTTDVYQDLGRPMSQAAFYTWNGSSYVQMDNAVYNATSFTSRYQRDAIRYGRGYDSTVWMKYADANGQRYVLVAELNATVPNFHITVDPPTVTPIPPYFDTNSSNLDYYFHIQSPFGNGINTNFNLYRSEYNQELYQRNKPPAIDQTFRSDEDVNVYTAYFNTNNLTYTRRFEGTVAADIYYNKAGFREDISSYDINTANGINYMFDQSGHRYYGSDDSQGQLADDEIHWYIHLPVIGNTICKVWDMFYGEDRKRDFLQECWQNYNGTRGVTIDTPTVFGMANTVRCYLGRVYQMALKINNLREDLDDGSIIIKTEGGELPYGSSTTEIHLTNIYYEMDTNTEHHVISTIDKSSNNNRIFYEDATSGTSKRTYYVPNYYSEWVRDDAHGTFYRTASGIYKIANRNVHNAPYYKRKVTDYPSWRYTKIYSRESFESSAGRQAVKLDESGSAIPGTIYGSLAAVNRILGTGLLPADSRDERTVLGLMNRMKDIIDNIDSQLEPGKVLITDANGVIKSSTFTTNDLEALDVLGVNLQGARSGIASSVSATNGKYTITFSQALPYGLHYNVQVTQRGSTNTVLNLKVDDVENTGFSVKPYRYTGSAYETYTGNFSFSWLVLAYS